MGRFSPTTLAAIGRPIRAATCSMISLPRGLAAAVTATADSVRAA